MHGYFHPDNEHLFLEKMSPGGSAKAKPTCFYRAKDKPRHLPSSMWATKKAIEITLTDPLSKKLNPFILTKPWPLSTQKIIVRVNMMNRI